MNYQQAEEHFNKCPVLQEFVAEQAFNATFSNLQPIEKYHQPSFLSFYQAILLARHDVDKIDELLVYLNDENETDITVLSEDNESYYNCAYALERYYNLTKDTVLLILSSDGIVRELSKLHS